jgi:hypothetical protein
LKQLWLILGEAAERAILAFRLFHVAYDGVAIVIGKQIPKPDRLLSRTTNFEREHCPGNSKLAEQNQDQHDNEYEAEPAVTWHGGGPPAPRRRVPPGRRC